MGASVLATEPLAYSHPSFAAVLTVLVLAPAAGALVLLAMPRSRPELFKLVALLASLVPAALVVWMLAAFDDGHRRTPSSSGISTPGSRGWASRGRSGWTGCRCSWW